MRRLSALALALVLLFLSAEQAWAQSPQWSSFEEALATAEDNGTKVMVDIFAPWCPWCKRMEEEVYPDQDVLDYLEEHFELTRLNIEEEDTTVRYEDETFSAPEMAVLLGAQGVPTIAFLDSDGEYLTHLPGFAERDEFLLVLEFVQTESFEEMTYMEFVEQREEAEE